MTEPSLLSVAAVIVAAGRGTRAGDAAPKQYRQIAGETILARAVRPFLDHPRIARVVVVIHPEDGGHYTAAVPPHDKLTAPVFGGASRQGSVNRGLQALAANPPDLVLIHDAARPFVTRPLIDRVIEALAGASAAVPALPVSDTLKRINPDGRVAETVPRAQLYAAQTPQGFDFAAIHAAHERAHGGSYTDDAAIAEAAGLEVVVVAGDPDNVKLTTAEDIAAAEVRLGAGETRVGTGYDVHAFGPGDHVMLGGLAIPHHRGLVGHSDADVVLHALTDAVLGALAEGDIGSHFPPSDPAWRGAASEQFLAFAASRSAARGGIIQHLDATILAEEPRIASYRDAMRSQIAGICAISVARVAVKATTSEGLGFIGREEGIAALATATIRLPRSIE